MLSTNRSSSSTRMYEFAVQGRDLILARYKNDIQQIRNGRNEYIHTKNDVYKAHSRDYNKLMRYLQTIKRYEEEEEEITEETVADEQHITVTSTTASIVNNESQALNKGVAAPASSRQTLSIPAHATIPQDHNVALINPPFTYSFRASTNPHQSKVDQQCDVEVDVEENVVEDQEDDVENYIQNYATSVDMMKREEEKEGEDENGMNEEEECSFEDDSDEVNVDDRNNMSNSSQPSSQARDITSEGEVHVEEEE